MCTHTLRGMGCGESQREETVPHWWLDCNCRLYSTTTSIKNSGRIDACNKVQFRAGPSSIHSLLADSKVHSTEWEDDVVFYYFDFHTVEDVFIHLLHSGYKKKPRHELSFSPPYVRPSVRPSPWQRGSNDTPSPTRRRPCQPTHWMQLLNQ